MSGSVGKEVNDNATREMATLPNPTVSGCVVRNAGISMPSASRFFVLASRLIRPAIIPMATIALQVSVESEKSS
jgi:hypothetical protein